MLTTIVAWIYFGCLSVLYGDLTLFLLRRLFNLQEEHIHDLPLLVLVGMSSLGLVAEAMAIFMGIDLTANWVVLAGGLLILSVRRVDLAARLRAGMRRLQGWHPALWVIFGVAVLFALVKSTDLPLNYDTGLYHAQTIRWIETDGTVPGLGNLHARLAYNSVWFPFVSLTSLSFLSYSSFHLAGSLVLLITLLLFLDRFNVLTRGVIRISSVMGLLLIFVGRRLFSREVSSPGTDLPTSLFVWVVLLLWVEKWERDESWAFDLYSAILIALSLYAVTLKLTAIPILLLPAATLISEVFRGRWKTIIPFSTLALAVFVPWAVRNVILSGYVIYPFAPLDLFPVDWKIPRDQVIQRLIGDRSWARNPGQVGTEILRQPPWRWMARWFRRQENFDQQLLILVSASVLGFVSTYWLVRGDKARSERSDLAFWLPYILCAEGLVYWIYSAPYVRFGYPVLGVLLALTLSPPLAWLLRQLRSLRTIFIRAAVVAAIAVSAVSLLLVDLDALQARWIRPAPYPRVQTADRELGNQRIHIPKKGNQCWDTPIPCTPRLEGGLTPRGDSLRSGYRIQGADVGPTIG